MGKVAAMKRSERETQTAEPEQVWSAVDEYVDGLLNRPDSVLDAVRESSAAAGLPEIAVTAGQGKLLHLLARMQGARRILEIGTLGGYSTIWLARALPADGRLITIEADAKHFEVSRANIARAGLSGIVDQRLGAALDVLPTIAEEERTPFDLIFIDADKENNAAYFEWAMRLSRVGSAIVIDNVVRQGQLADASTDDSRVHGARRLHEVVAAEPRVSATTVQTVGSKGYDGFTLALVIS